MNGINALVLKNACVRWEESSVQHPGVEMASFLSRASVELNATNVE